MKKTKQILAIIGIVVLLVPYISMLISALSGGENFMHLLMVSIYASVIIPVLIWAYSFIYKLSKKRDDNDKSADESTNKDSETK